jgi:hypothetical protein
MALLSLAREGGGRDARSADLRPACQPDESRRASSPDGGGIATDLLSSRSLFRSAWHLHHRARNARGSHPSGMPCAGMKSASHAVHPHLALRERGQPTAPALRDFIFNCSSPCEDERVAGAPFGFVWYFCSLTVPSLAGERRWLARRSLCGFATGVPAG